MNFMRAFTSVERPLQTLHFSEGIFFRTKHAVRHDFAGDAGAQADLAVDGGRADGDTSGHHKHFERLKAGRLLSKVATDRFGHLTDGQSQLANVSYDGKVAVF